MRNQLRKMRDGVFECNDNRRFLLDILRWHPTLGLALGLRFTCQDFVIVVVKLSCSYMTCSRWGKIFILWTFAFLANFFSALRRKHKFFQQGFFHWWIYDGKRFLVFLRSNYVNTIARNMLYFNTRGFSPRWREELRSIGFNPRPCAQDRWNRMDLSIGSSGVNTDLSSLELLSFINCA